MAKKTKTQQKEEDLKKRKAEEYKKRKAEEDKRTKEAATHPSHPPEEEGGRGPSRQEDEEDTTTQPKTRDRWATFLIVLGEICFSFQNNFYL